MWVEQIIIDMVGKLRTSEVLPISQEVNPR
jgi:hypothetical protein